MHNTLVTIKHTLHEFLARVLLEERLVENRAREIVDHKVQHRLDFLLRITCIVGQSNVLHLSVYGSKVAI